MGQITYMTVDGKAKRVVEDVDTGTVSDGFHTIDELYRHRNTLFLTLLSSEAARSEAGQCPAWIAEQHHDGTMYPGYFIAGLATPKGEQITYHMLIADHWEDAVRTGVPVIARAPAWDGIEGASIERLRSMW